MLLKSLTAEKIFTQYCVCECKMTLASYLGLPPGNLLTKVLSAVVLFSSTQLVRDGHHFRRDGGSITRHTVENLELESLNINQKGSSANTDSECLDLCVEHF